MAGIGLAIGCLWDSRPNGNTITPGSFTFGEPPGSDFRVLAERPLLIAKQETFALESTGFAAHIRPMMRSDRRHRLYATPIGEWIAAVPNELPIDAVGLWQIVPAGRDGFELSGQDLIEFVRLTLLALLERGAKPVMGAVDGVHIWTLVPYGETPAQIADAIIKEWSTSGREPDAGDVWFALPHIYESKRPSSETAQLPKSN
jgi:hypothetical protein